MREVIVTGGAGYIGSHIAQEFLDQGFHVHVIDNLQTGYKEFIPVGAQVHVADIRNSEQISDVFAQLKNPTRAGVIHAAGLKFAGESLKAPLDFYEANTSATVQLLKVMSRFGVSSLVFSSSSSVYGQHGINGAVAEDSPLMPISPYGRSKLFAEEIINDVKVPLEINSIALRYFNVIGNRHGCGLDLSNFNLLPNLYRAAESNKLIKIFGDSYSTPDGTCIRDYVDVRQLAKAHFDSLELLSSKMLAPPAINLGSGNGYSVQEVIEVLQDEIRRSLKIEVVPGRLGDPAVTLADISTARKILDWKPTYSLRESVVAGWEAWKSKPELQSH